MVKPLSETEFIKRYHSKITYSITVDDADKMYLTVGKGMLLKWLFSAPCCQTGELRTTYFTGPLRTQNLQELYRADIALQEIGQSIHIA